MQRAIVFLTVLALTALVVVPTLAQDAKPEPVGLRPDAPPYALHGPYWVGAMELAAKTESHPTTVQLWYPALNPKGVEETVSRVTSQGRMITHAMKDALPDGSAGPYPLVIFVHSLDQQRFAAIYLTEHLASHGFVVMAIDYTDNATVPAWYPPNPIPANLLFTRPEDVSWQIDYAQTLTASEGKLPNMIDTEHVAVIGHAFGGDTALEAAGARLDASNAWCTEYPDARLPMVYGGSRACDIFPLVGDKGQKELAALMGLETIPKDLWPSLGDSRVDAIVPLAPGSATFGSEGAKTVTAPAMVFVASRAEVQHAEYKTYIPWLYENLGSATKSLVVLEGADDPIFGNDCDTALDWTPAGYFWACSDLIWDKHRAHDLTNHFTTAFLLDTLKGDPEAHAALLAENVSFPGITYETTMK